MAVPPFTKQDFKNIIPTANSSLCRKMVLTLVRLPVLVYQLVDFIFADDMSLSPDVKAGVGGAVGQLAAPSSLSATDGTFTDRINLTWAPVGGATYYEVWRAPRNDNASAVLLTPVTAASYTDDDISDDNTYWYFVKARNATDTSAFSLGESGFTDSSGGGGTGATGQRQFDGDGTLVIPAGVTTIQVESWGGGGGGGGSGCPFCVVGSAFYGGGGGGGGEYRKVRSIAVTPGEPLTIVVGVGGTAGAGGFATSGSNGGDTVVRRLTVDLVVSRSGAGGGAGATGPSNGAGGAGGSGGSNSVGVLDTQNNGATGTGGTLGTPPVGGSGAAQNTGGGNGGGNGGANSAGSAGSKGKMLIVWPSP